MCRVVVALVVVGCMLLTVSAPTQATERKKQDESKAPVYTNADLPPAPPSSSGSSSPVPAPALLMPATESLPSYDGHRDRDGRGEGWWRYRATLLDAECLAAQLLAEELHVDYAKGKTLTDSTLASRSREATLAWREVEARRDQLPEEMRQTGGLPGWLRRGEPDWLADPLPAPVPATQPQADPSLLTWKPVHGAAFYLVEVQCTDCCGLMAPCDSRTLYVSRASARFPFESGGSGRWRVLALDSAGIPGEWSDWLDR
jgi:hypothetical protein